jgi:hypothetical protein
MAGTMIPVVNGDTAQKRIPKPLIAHTLGGTAGGLFMGAVLGSLRDLLPGIVHQRDLVFDLVLGVLALLLALRAARLVNVPLPESRWQVPRRWLSSMPFGSAAGAYGLCLGAVIFTRIVPSMYLLMAWIIVRGGMGAGATTLAVYGLARSLPLWVVYWLCGQDGGKRHAYVVGGAALWDPAVSIASSAVLIVMSGFFIMLHHV